MSLDVKVLTTSRMFVIQDYFIAFPKPGPVVQFSLHASVILLTNLPL